MGFAREHGEEDDRRDDISADLFRVTSPNGRVREGHLARPEPGGLPAAD
jgi:hypothetical protein